MKRLSRRRFLGAGAGLAAGAVALAPGTAHATGYTALGSSFKVLEIFLKGGLSMAETLWSVDLPTTSWSFIDPGVRDLEWSTLLPATVDPADVPPDFAFTRTFLETIPASSRDLFLGPSVIPLANVGALSRARVVATGHDLLPHEAAVPFTLMGNRLGRAVSCGAGAVVNHLNAAIAVPSIVLHSQADTVLHHALATGQLGAEHTPLAIRVGDNVSFDRSVLEASGFSKGDGDGLRGLYVDRYEGLLTHSAARTRSRAFDAYDAANLHLENWFSIDSLLSPLDLTVPASPDYADNATVTSILAAAELLGTTTVEYALVFDQGLDNDYDSHNVTPSFLRHAERQAANFWSVCYALAAAINAGTLDLDDTMVVINTEFGRKDKDGGTGTEHNHDGYATMLIGGPIGTPGVIGDLDDDAISDGLVTPVDLRAAIGFALGFDGFTATSGDPIFDPAESALGGNIADVETTFFL